jgi:hypothetical protein
MKSIIRLVTAVVAVMFAVATPCPAQDVKPTDLGKGAAFNGKKIEISTRRRDNSSIRYLRTLRNAQKSKATSIESLRI